MYNIIPPWIAETKDFTLHGALFYIRRHLFMQYLPAENHMGFSLWPFYEQSCHVGHSVVQAQIQLWGGGVWQKGVYARLCVYAAWSW